MKRKFLILAPVIALVLSGCTLFGPKKSSKKKKSSSVTTSLTSNTSDSSSTKSTSSSSGSEDEKVVGSINNPIAISEFQTHADELINYESIESGKSVTDKSTLFFVKGKVTSSSAFNNYKEIQYLNMDDTTDSSKKITGYFAVVDSSITTDYSAENSLAGKEIVIKGYACLLNSSKKGKTYELAKKDNDHKPTIVKVDDIPPVPGLDYGSLEDPLTTSEAWAVLDQQNPTAQKMYVTGKVTENTAWSTQFNNVDITISDGTKEFKIFRATTFPSGFNKEGITTDSLKDKTVVASGIGTIYTKDSTTIYEFQAGCEVHSITSDAPTSVVITSGDKVGVNGTLSLTANVLPATASQEVTWSIAEGTAATVSGSTLTAGATAGSVTVRATATGTDVHADKVITITDEAIPVTGVSLDASELTVGIGKTKTLVATIAPETATDKVVTWSSNHENIATVANGVVTGVAVGTATITVTTHDGGHTDTCEVTVSESEEHTLTWTASKAADLGGKIAAAGGTATGTISTGEFSWNYTRTLVALANDKEDNIQFMGGTWIQLGSNNALESVSFETSAISGTIKSVTVVVATAGTHTLTVDVGGTKYLNGVALQTYSGQASATNPDPANCAKTGTGTSSGAITITVAQSDTGTKKAMLIRSIEVVAVY